MSLKKKATKGILWVAVERFGQQLLQGIIFIILARLLSPEDFGLVGMLVIFFAIAQTFVDSGMGQALIREKEISDEDRSTVFWFNLFLSILFYALLYFSAPWIADFYNQPKLISLTRVMGLNILFFAIAVVQRAEMTQQMEFKKQALAQVPAMALSGGISIWMAYVGYGVWAIAAQYLLMAFFGSLLLWLLQPVKIKFIWSRESFNKLFGFGYKLLFSGLLNTIFENIFKLIIGKYFSLATLGFFTQAQKLQRLASNNLSNLIQKVSYPILARLGDEKEKLKSGYKKVIVTSSFVIFPLITFLMIMAHPIIVVLLGQKWVEAVPFLQYLCGAGLVIHINAINLNLLKVLGRSDLVLKLAFFKKSILLIAIVIGLQFGIWGLMIIQVVTSYTSLIINIYYTERFIGYAFWEQLKDVIQVFAFVVPIGLILWFLNDNFAMVNWFSLILSFIGYIGAYFAVNLLAGTESGRFVAGLIRGKLGIVKS